MTRETRQRTAARSWVRWLPAAAWACGIFAASSVPGSSIPGGYSVVGHLGEYAVLGSAVLFAVWKSPARQAAVIALLACAVYALSDEAHQAFVPGRTPDPLDWLADMIGAGVAVSALLLARQWTAGRRSTSREL